jgi:predicted DNA-binding antitoxin AbrB/MazE fold protein
VRGRGTIVVVRLVEARYENGVLLPVDRLGLRPGESVNLIVVRRPVAGRWDLPKLAKAGSAEDLALAERGLAEWASAVETSAAGTDRASARRDLAK